MNRDSSSFERQLIDALKGILRAVGGSSSGSTSSSTSSSSSSSSAGRSVVTALNGIATRLDGINGDLHDIIIGEEPVSDDSDDNNE